MAKSPKSKFIVLMAVLVIANVLVGCDFIDGVAEAVGLSTAKDEAESVKEAEPIPVIVVETPETEEVLTEEAEPEIVEEYIRDYTSRTYSVETAERDTLLMSFVGDINFCDEYANMRKYRECGSEIPNVISQEVLAEMDLPDIMMANNEFAYSDRGSPTAGKQYTFRAKPEMAEKLHDMSIDLVALANNHAYDWGPDALMDTFEILRGVDVPYVGAGENLEEAMKPVYMKANGYTIAFVSATQIERTSPPDTKEATEDSPGVIRTLDPKRFVSIIEEAESNSDFTVVYVHWGSESTDLVEDSQRDLAQKYVDAGADLVIGDHSHCLQGIDYVSASSDSAQDSSVKVPVFYSLGNFWFNSKTLDTCIVKVAIDTTHASADENGGTGDFAEGEAPTYLSRLPIKEIRFIPCIQQGCKTRMADDTESARIIEYMRGISNHAWMDEAGVVTYSEEDHNTQNGANTFPGKKSEPATVVAPDAGLLETVPDAAALEALPTE